MTRHSALVKPQALMAIATTAETMVEETSMRTWFLIPLLIAACGGSDTDALDSVVDDDGDGFTVDIDCDDEDATIHPSRDEVCDGVDNNCDGEIDGADAVDAIPRYPDADSDGSGRDDDVVYSCVRLDGHADQGGDCLDSDPRFRPGAPEEDCTDPNDYNCDGAVGYVDNDGDGHAACKDCNDRNTDEHPGALWFPDRDRDGFGAPVALTACARPEEHVTNPNDCDDTNAEIHPDTVWYADSDSDGYGSWDASEVSCQASVPSSLLPGDCDDAEPRLNPETVWYLDADNDGYGVEENSITTCTPPMGYVLEAGDCDDTHRYINPGRLWFADSDGDGEGDFHSSIRACESPAGYVDNYTDCLDSDPTRNSKTRWYPDSDSDGHGAKTVYATSCYEPAGFAETASDCDDGDDTVNPDAAEECDDVDHDCDGDEGLADCSDCDALLTADATRKDGIYTIDVDGLGGDDAFEVFCDMTADAGGWTRFWWYDAGTGFAGVKDTLGGAVQNCDPARDTRCFGALPVASPAELLVADGIGGWAVFTFDAANDTSERVLDTLTSAWPAPGVCGDAWDPTATSTGDSFACDSTDLDGAGCSCFAYESRGGVWSFALDDDLDAVESAFAAGGDGLGGMGVDVLEPASRGNSPKRGLELYWR